MIFCAGGAILNVTFPLRVAAAVAKEIKRAIAEQTVLPFNLMAGEILTLFICKILIAQKDAPYASILSLPLKIGFALYFFGLNFVFTSLLLSSFNTSVAVVFAVFDPPSRMTFATFTASFRFSSLRFPILRSAQLTAFRT